MKTNFGMGNFMGRMPFGGENMREKWGKMTDDEKKSFLRNEWNG